MALSDTDRHRLVAATVLTLLALPALWWANTSQNSSAPNLAVAGIDAGVDADAGTDPDTMTVGQNSAATAPAAELDVAPPVFLDGPASAAGAGQSEIAVPAKPLLDGITARATFRGNVSNGTCIISGVPSGSRITVVNLDNNRSITCSTALAPGNLEGSLVMNTSAFASIADLTDAPISVEIRR